MQELIERHMRTAAVKKFDDHYTILERKLGKGLSGSIQACKRKSDGATFAMKAITHVWEIELRRELLVGLLSEPCENIVRLVDFINMPDQPYYLFFEEAQSSLYRIILAEQRLTEHKTARAVWQIANALAFLHSHDILHRDVKPDNVLVFENTQTDLKVKLCDFGLISTCQMNDRIQRGYVGTRGYYAPEVLEARRNGAKKVPLPYCGATDMWSLGVCTVDMLFGRTLFECKANKDSHVGCEDCLADIAAKRDLKVLRKLRREFRINKAAVDFARTLLAMNPAKRLTANEVLRDRWVTAPEHPKADELGLGWRILARIGEATASTIPEPIRKYHNMPFEYCGE